MPFLLPNQHRQSTEGKKKAETVGDFSLVTDSQKFSFGYTSRAGVTPNSATVLQIAVYISYSVYWTHVIHSTT